ncbi:DNase-NucA-NucB domain containing protein [Pyrenophora tritici-repentis]|nr:DNase-NucA-NucB domain containing protein [Pyrenophora tritici-repentis]
MYLNIVSWGAVISLAVNVQAQVQQRNYNCNNQQRTCNNICYWLTCVQPTINTFTRDSGNAATVRQRRVDCGVTHRPRPCTLPGLGVGGDWTDEFPFASTLEGGRTPNGDGAALLCTPSAEQRTQAAYLTNHIYGNPLMPQGTQFQLVMQNTGGIEYCDPAATPNGCDGSLFDGFHYFNDDDIYCQWDISASSGVTCVDGQGNPAQPPAKKKRDMGMQEPRAANWSNLLHISDPKLAKRMKADMPESVALPLEE